MLTKLTAQGFVNKWRGVQLKEGFASQEHFLDLCQLIGHPTSAEAVRSTVESGFAPMLPDLRTWHAKGTRQGMSNGF